MPKDKAFDPELVEFLVIASLSIEFAHMINNLLGTGPIRLNFALDSLDKLDISSDKRRKIEQMIGGAIDDMKSVLGLTSLFRRLSRQEGRERATLMKLMQDIVRELTPLARRRNYSIEIDSLSDQYASMVCASSLGQVVLNVLMFSISHSPSLSWSTQANLCLLIRETDILVTADNPVFSNLIHAAFNYETEDDLLNWKYLNLYIALKMAREMDGDIQLTEADGKSAIAIQVPTHGQ